MNSKKRGTVIAKTNNIDYASNDDEFMFIFTDPGVMQAGRNVISIGAHPDSKIADSLTIYQNNKVITKLDFRHTNTSSFRKEAVKFHRFVAIGMSGYFYLYDLSSSLIVLFIDLIGYFEAFKIHDNHLLLAYNSGIYCLTKYGSIKWHNNSIGIDGVIIVDIKEDSIFGHEQIDPPNGWKDFVLDFNTGINK
jgi:hypothetical protein